MNSDRSGCGGRTSFFGNVQPRRIGWPELSIRFRLDWALHRDRRSARAFHTLIRLIDRWDESEIIKRLLSGAKHCGVE